MPATGGTVTVKAIRGVVQQLPRKRVEEVAEISSQDEYSENAPLHQAVTRRT